MELPEPLPHVIQIRFALVAHRGDLVEVSFGVDPAECVNQDIELTSVVTDNDQAPSNAVLDDALHQGAFGGNLHMSCPLDSLFFEVLVPLLVIIKNTGLIHRQKRLRHARGSLLSSH